MAKVAIFGAGQIGRAAFKIVSDLALPGYEQPIIIDSYNESLKAVGSDSTLCMDLTDCPMSDIVDVLKSNEVEYIINALPFFLNDRIATAAVSAGCNYIDFTEDDTMADKVQAIYKDTGLTCAVKCGLAPGFVNYIGLSLANKIKSPKSLMVSVGALPKTAVNGVNNPGGNYNLSWSVDGLVNEYVRPCRVRRLGIETEWPAIRKEDQIEVNLDGSEYEAAMTSGGVGSLIKDLPNIPNIQYMTLRYPGHYDYVRSVIEGKTFDEIRQLFLSVFPFTTDDVIVVYANCLGRDANNRYVRETYYKKFYGINGLTGIQSTTAGSGVAVLELMINGKVNGLVDHKDINLDDLKATKSFSRYYNTVSTT